MKIIISLLSIFCISFAHADEHQADVENPIIEEMPTDYFPSRGAYPVFDPGIGLRPRANPAPRERNRVACARETRAFDARETTRLTLAPFPIDAAALAAPRGGRRRVAGRPLR